jgi:hypothetical protein
MKSLALKIICIIWFGAALVGSSVAQSAARDVSTAWHEGRFHVDVAGVIGRSDIVLGKPNADAAEAMPLGNGRLGVAVWSADGLTAQLNRGDTMPDRWSPGQVVIPGIATLTRAKDYSGRLDLYHGEFREQGGGMTVTAWVEPDTDALIVDVTGANPHEIQTAQLRLWAPRTPLAQAKGQVGLLSEAWLDNKHPESSSRAFGSLSAITVDGRGVSAAVTDPLTITITFTPYADGHFRVIAAAPHYEGKGDSRSMASRELLAPRETLHRARWQAFWNRAAPIKITSEDGAGEYMENLRAIYLYVAALEKGEEFPGTHAGIADMINAARDTHKWDPSAFWHWNLRMQVAANIGAGLSELNASYFNLYRENLVNMEEWTRKHMNGRLECPAYSVPVEMRETR